MKSFKREYTYSGLLVLRVLVNDYSHYGLGFFIVPQFIYFSNCVHLIH